MFLSCFKQRSYGSRWHSWQSFKLWYVDIPAVCSYSCSILLFSLLRIDGEVSPSLNAALWLVPRSVSGLFSYVLQSRSSWMVSEVFCNISEFLFAMVHYMHLGWMWTVLLPKSILWRFFSASKLSPVVCFKGYVQGVRSPNPYNLW